MWAGRGEGAIQHARESGSPQGRSPSRAELATACPSTLRAADEVQQVPAPVRAAQGTISGSYICLRGGPLGRCVPWLLHAQRDPSITCAMLTFFPHPARRRRYTLHKEIK